MQLEDGKADIKLENDEIVKLAPVYSWRSSSSTPDPAQNLNGRTLSVEASVTETVTGKKINSTNTVAFQRYKYKLEFLDNTPDSFKIGLTYTGFVSYTHTTCVHILSLLMVLIHVWANFCLLSAGVSTHFRDKNLFINLFIMWQVHDIVLVSCRFLFSVVICHMKYPESLSIKCFDSFSSLFK